MRANRIGQVRRDDEGVGTTLAFRVMDVQGILAVRAFDRFHGNGLAAFLTHVPDGGIDLAGFKVFGQDRLLSQEAAGERREQCHPAQECEGTHSGAVYHSFMSTSTRTRMADYGLHLLGIFLGFKDGEP